MSNFWEPYRRWFLIGGTLILPEVAQLKLDVIAGELNLPEAEHLDRFEQAAGFRLPTSYRDFVLCFGRGEFECPLDVYFAIPKANTRWLFPNKTFREDYIELRNEAREVAARGDDPSAAIYARLVFFAGYGNGGYYAWDPADVTDPATGDARIYRVDYAEDDTEAPYAKRLEDFATSFTDFMLRHVFLDHFRGIDPATEAPTPAATRRSNPRIFRPERSRP